MEEGYRHTIKRWRRRDEPDSLFPFVLLPLLGLLFLFLLSWLYVAPHMVETPNQLAAEQALEAQGLGWVKVEPAGQDLYLTGTPPATGEGAKAVEVAQAALAPTWLGMLPPAIRVYDNFDAVKAAKPVAAAPKAKAPPAKKATRADWVFDVHDTVLKLTGMVPDQATHDAIVADATQRIDNTHITRIDNALTIGTGTAAAGYLGVARRGLAGLGQCDTGRASWTQRVFDFRCELPAARKSSVESLVGAPMGFGRLGRVELLVPEEVASCEKALTSILSTSHINFATGSDAISPTSNGLLDKVAEAAKACPGTLRVEGHTDNVGKVDFNLDLSQRRAQSTVAALSKRGLDAKRLVAKGYGPNKPISDNNTDAGKAANRRIEIHVVRSAD